jgi:hypothetical protein
VDPQPITEADGAEPTDGRLAEIKGTRDPKCFAFTSLCWFYGPKAKYFFPEASGADDTIVVVMEAAMDYQDAFTPAPPPPNGYGNTGAGLTFNETYLGDGHDGQKHW